MLDGCPGAVIMAGGLDVVTRMKLGGVPRTVIGLDRVAGLDAVAFGEGGDTIEVGAMVRHDSFARNALVRSHLPDLASAWDRIATIRIRFQGTLVGNVLAREPSYEGAALLMAMDASALTCAGAAPLLTLAGAQAGGQATRDIVRGISLPLPAPGETRRLVYARGLRPGLAVALRLDHAGGRIHHMLAVLGGCHAWPLVRDVPARGLALCDLAAAAPALAERVFEGRPPLTVPWFGVAGYREAMAPVLLRRLIAEAAR